MSDHLHQYLTTVDDVGILYAYAFGVSKTVFEQLRTGQVDQETALKRFDTLVDQLNGRLDEMRAEAEAVAHSSPLDRHYRVLSLPDPDPSPIYEPSENGGDQNGAEGPVIKP